MATVEEATMGRRLRLHGVPWGTYCALRELPENYHVRMTYDRGDLEIMSPSPRHEQWAALIGRLIEAWTEECNVDIAGRRTMTFQREDLQRGLEPDNCYYIQHEADIRSKRELDFTVDPPPDLVVEVDLTSSSSGKLPLYAAFGVPEVWRYNGSALEILLLGDDGQYQSAAESRALPGIKPELIERILARVGTESETSLVRAFRVWVGQR